ncbi:hypothetical protein [Marinomonas communis]|uniref:hypothetical protein n=1 Tax=Marinomonas communis TaxID=28254 RepID=UPI001D192C98|nr:hypothetical protein [Marinomonas communis]MCC4275873.1 hypothetical protein [Marinomonas communis]
MLETLRALIEHTTMFELDDRVEFSFKPSQIRALENFEISRLYPLKLRWEGELQDDWSEFSKIPDDANCKAIINKHDILESEVTADVEEHVQKLLFLSEDFYFNWLHKATSEIFSKDSCLNKFSSTVIWLGFGNIQVQGKRLSIISMDRQPLSIFKNNDNITIPSSADIKAQTHFVGQTETICEPLNYRLPSHVKACALTQPFYNAYEKLLCVALSKEFLGSDDIVISGIKRLNMRLVDNNHSCDLSRIKTLESVVSWVYQERTQVRLLLVMDRVSLDLVDNTFLIPSIHTHLANALEQAKDKYEFVIKDRKEAHAKELSEFQKDIKSATDSYSKSSNDLVSGLFKDALSAIFFLAIMLFSRLIGKEELLDSKNVHWLFKILACYLVVSPLIRIYFERQSLILALSDLSHWKDTTRNHISHKDINELINSRTSPYKCLYRKAMLLVIFSSIILSIFAWNVPSILNHDSASEAQSELQVTPTSAPSLLFPPNNINSLNDASQLKSTDLKTN